ncbi:MAG: acyl-CoA dehydrogenase family protein [Acidimicrobiia bacterium]|nr:acyl-CoA dehydrogenase family protein [Acidimicrobiia bacterium]
MATYAFEYTEPTDEERALREEVRAFLAAELPAEFAQHEPSLGMSARHSAEFSKKMAEKGWLGMALPRRYGGHDRNAVARFVVVEEMLRSGAPVGAHWVADRQTGPQLMHFGTEAQREKFLPAIAAGECWFSIGMSEPDSGSDLASVRTQATKGDGGWLLNGTKIWTSGAQRNHYFIVLCRTHPAESSKHQGLSQFLVPLDSPGLTINPIAFLDGTTEFNEVVMEDVFVPDDMVVGELGHGWQQVTSELAFERAGPDRFLSAWQVFTWFVDKLGDDAPPDWLERAGRISARFWSLRQLSMAVSRAIDAGGAPAVEASIVKDIGTNFEQEIVQAIAEALDHEPSLDEAEVGAQLLARAVLTGPSFTIRGGTTEILRSVAAKGLRR